MFGKLLKKLLGRKAGSIADTIVDGALDVATKGASSRIEQAFKDGDLITAANEAAPIVRKVRNRK